MDEVLQRTSYKTDVGPFAAVGFGEISANFRLNRLTEKERREAERAKAKAVADELVKGGEVKQENKDSLVKIRHEGGVVIEGASGLPTWIAKCCNPVPGDAIVGYITKGRGVAVHRVDCMNLKSQEMLRSASLMWTGKRTIPTRNKTWPILTFTASPLRPPQ